MLLPHHARVDARFKLDLIHSDDSHVLSRLWHDTTRELSFSRRIRKQAQRVLTHLTTSHPPTYDALSHHLSATSPRPHHLTPYLAPTPSRNNLTFTSDHFTPTSHCLSQALTTSHQPSLTSLTHTKPSSNPAIPQFRNAPLAPLRLTRRAARRAGGVPADTVAAERRARGGRARGDAAHKRAE